MHGVLDARYRRKRLTRRDVIYRLGRRTSEVAKAAERFLNRPGSVDCLDVGAADGAMLSALKERLHLGKAVGIDMSKELIAFNRDRSIRLVHGNAESLPFNDGAFDLVVASALIEHVENPARAVKEFGRVLRPGGLLVMTFPSPAQNMIGMSLFYIRPEEHSHVITMHWLSELLGCAGFEIVHRGGFMVSPFFRVPSEPRIEPFLNRTGLHMLMSNQTIVGRKPS